MGKIGAFFKKIGGGIKKAFNWVKQNIAPTVRQILPAVKPLIGMIPEYGPQIVRGIDIGERIAGGADKMINGNAQDRINLIKDNVGELVQHLGGGRKII
jgi:uncharacterized protein YjbJ (UPF0337 family)